MATGMRKKQISALVSADIAESEEMTKRENFKPMSKEMRRLAEMSGFVFWRDEPWKPYDAEIDWSCDYSEEFKIYTEHVIRKCIQICEKGTPTQTTSSGASQDIKNHFGLK
jgi:hypothetical protein